MALHTTGSPGKALRIRVAGGRYQGDIRNAIARPTSDGSAY